MKTFIIYILAIMILYDFSLHVVDSLRFFKKITYKHPFGVWKLMQHFGGEDPVKKRTVYNIFWTSYWGLASILILLYLNLQG